MKIKKKYVLVSLCILSLLSIILIVLPIIIKHQLVCQLESILKRPVLLDDVDLNLFTLELRLEKFEIQESSSTNRFVSFDDFYLNVSWRSLLHQIVIIEKMHLNKPNFHAVMQSDATFNFSDLIPESKNVTSASNPPVNELEKKTLNLDNLPINFNIQNVAIQNGSMSFQDHMHGRTHTLNQLNFHLPQLTNIPMTADHPAEITLNFIINNCHVQTHTQANLFNEIPEANIHFTNDGGNFSFYQPYLSKFIDWNITSGELNTDMNFKVKVKNNTPDLIIQGNVKIVDFELRENQQNKLISFPLLDLQLKDSRPIKSQINLALIKLSQPNVNIFRRKDQSINLIPVLKNTSFADQKKKKKNATKPDETKSNNKPSSKPTNVLDIKIQKVVIDNGQINIKDSSIDEPFKTQLKKFQLISTGIHLKDQKISSIDFQTEILPHGKINIKGSLQLSPQKWDGHVLIEDLDISMAHPYLKEFLNGHLESGRLFVQSDTYFEQKKNTPHIQLSGNLALKHFIFKEPAKSEGVLSWDNFEIKQINSGLFPHYLDIDEVRLDHLKAKISLLENGKLNWLALTKEKDTPKKPEESTISEPSKDLQNPNTIISEPSSPTNSIKSASAEPSKQTQCENIENISKTTTTDNKKQPFFQRLNIRKVVLENSNIHFLDKTMKPAFLANMAELHGHVLGFDQDSGKPARFVLNGKLNDLSPLQVVGRVSPFQDPLALKVEILFEGIEVPLFTTYTRHYIGYPLAKGKLTLNLDYLVEKNQLTSKNNITLNQLELGEKAENAKIPALPLKFALALLKDRDGKIQMNIPITGSLDDLNFSLTEVILNTLQNTLNKIVTSPFTFLAQAFGGKEDIQSLTFNYGKSSFNKSTRTKIKQLANLLSRRPLLKLQLLSYLNTSKETSALKRNRLRKEMELIKFKERTTRPIDNDKLKHVVIEKSEYDQYLVKLYQFRYQKVPAPKYQNRQSLEPTLLSTIDINHEDLEALSLKRMVNVRNALVDKYKIASDRIFLGERNARIKNISKGSASQIILKLK